MSSSVAERIRERAGALGLLARQLVFAIGEQQQARTPERRDASELFVVGQCAIKCGQRRGGMGLEGVLRERRERILRQRRNDRRAHVRIREIERRALGAVHRKAHCASLERVQVKIDDSCPGAALDGLAHLLGVLQVLQ